MAKVTVFHLGVVSSRPLGSREFGHAAYTMRNCLTLWREQIYPVSINRIFCSIATHTPFSKVFTVVLDATDQDFA